MFSMNLMIDGKKTPFEFGVSPKMKQQLMLKQEEMSEESFAVLLLDRASWKVVNGVLTTGEEVRNELRKAREYKDMVRDLTRNRASVFTLLRGDRPERW